MENKPSEDINNTKIEASDIEQSDLPTGKKLKLNNSDSVETKVFQISEEQRSNFNKIINFNNEEKCGITSFVHPERLGFDGIIKNRYSDFLVNEVDPSGKVVHITELYNNEEQKSKNEDDKVENVNESNESTEKKEPIEDKKEEPIVEAQAETVCEIDEQDYQGLVDLFNSAEGPQKLNDEDKEQLIQGLKSLLVTKDKSTVKSKALDDKELRTKIHVYVRNHFNSSFYTVTSTEDSSILFSHKNLSNPDNRGNLRGNRQSKKGGKKSGEKAQSEYVHFSLYKENRETNDLIGFIARTTKTPSKSYTFAGTKDRRGITVQRISAHKVTIQKLNGVNKVVKNACLSDFKFENGPLRLGDLTGNQFTLIVRNVQLRDEDNKSQSLDESINQIEENLKLFKEEPLAINYFGMQRFGTTAIPTHVIGTALLNSDWKKAVDLILDPREGQHSSEVDARQKWRENRQDALKLFPKWCVAERALLTFFIKSNENPITNYLGALMGLPRNLRSMYLHAYQSYIWNHMVNYRIKTHEESQLQEYTLKDVVLPMPGHQVKYPQAPGVYEAYVELMARDGLEPSKMTRNQWDFSLPGDYRPLVISARNFDYEIFKYDDETIPLALTDLDKINGVNNPESIPNGQKLAIKMQFELNSSGYATMILREIMKVRTESAFQASIAKTNSGNDQKASEAIVKQE
ncbi:tRNA pseudouridine synthase D [Conidiobolus coronatus NRRL 28638]|uniref:tRNA pseudouridine synthase D n=1 Tax=Conidiobolus coronatus (strain ATCC 28846 / CBS 209.66 / NRRL 28638) TaxID=796925 RepID=A0A137PJ72_CONC2|nr:tRNA pseudouridine synthase D [Conidiobolus coronatus NRRL 28638]|eukprot:KXN75047.1 tRNA pseudouridine synthase D [Conidiobolus coronatus NRRL 28638]